MPLYLDPTGKSTYGIRVCDRCQTKYYFDEISPDGNSPGLMVCQPCWDSIDPWRLPFIPADANITLKRARPDTSIDNTVCYVVDEDDGAVIPGACPVDDSVYPSSE